MSTTSTTLPRKMPRDYAGLTDLFPLRPIHDESELENATEMAHRLAVIDENRLTRDQADYLEMLSTAIERYEDQRHAIDTTKLTPLDVLEFLLAEHGMSGSDLGRLLGQRTLGPAILAGRRQLSKAHIKCLADHFNVDARVLLGA